MVIACNISFAVWITLKKWNIKSGKSFGDSDLKA